MWPARLRPGGLFLRFRTGDQLVDLDDLAPRLVCRPGCRPRSIGRLQSIPLNVIATWPNLPWRWRRDRRAPRLRSAGRGRSMNVTRFDSGRVWLRCSRSRCSCHCCGTKAFRGSRLVIQMEMSSLLTLDAIDRAIGDFLVGLSVQRHPDRKTARCFIPNYVNAANGLARATV
jgi:hypothetical protein